MNTWRVGEALTSVRRLAEIIDQMTLEEVERALMLEENSSRRKVIIDKLFRRHRFLLRQRSFLTFINAAF